MPVKTILGIGSGLFSSNYNQNRTQEINQQNAKLNQHYWNIQNEKLYEQSEQAAQNAMGRTIDLYNLLQSPSALVQQYKDAGLNPALLYGMGGNGGKVTNAPQGNGGQSGSGAPTLGLQNFLQMDPLTLAQLQNINADTEKKEEEADNLKENTKKTKSEIKLNEINEEILKKQKKLMQFDIDFKEATWAIEYEKLYNEMMYWNGMAQYQVAQGELAQETYDTMVETAKQNLSNLKMEHQVNEILIKKYGDDIKTNATLRNKARAETENIKQATENLKAEFKRIEADTDLKLEQCKTEQERQNVLKQEEKLKEAQEQEILNKYSWDTFTKEDAKFLLHEALDFSSNFFNKGKGKFQQARMAYKIAKNATN